jgi:hypothetical protein
MLLHLGVTAPIHDERMDITTSPPTDSERQVLQLTLLPETGRSNTSNLPVQFLLDQATRRRGARHVAEIRQLLAQRAAARQQPAAARRSPSRRPEQAA